MEVDRRISLVGHPQALAFLEKLSNSLMCDARNYSMDVSQKRDLALLVRDYCSALAMRNWSHDHVLTVLDNRLELSS